MDAVVDLTDSPAPARAVARASSVNDGSAGRQGGRGATGSKRRHPAPNDADLSQRRQVLRIAASSVAAVAGLHPFSDRAVEKFLDHVYQDMFDEYARDARACGLELVSQEEHVRALIDRIGGEEAAVLKAVRREAEDGAKVETTAHAAALQKKVAMVVSSAAANASLAKEDRTALQRDLEQQVRACMRVCVHNQVREQKRLRHSATHATRQ
jgi:hypothetical protein